jgi:hypothetical protein
LEAVLAVSIDGRRRLGLPPLAVQVEPRRPPVLSSVSTMADHRDMLDG